MPAHSSPSSLLNLQPTEPVYTSQARSICVVLTLPPFLPNPPLPTFTHIYPPLPTFTHPLPTFTHLYPPLSTFTHLCSPSYLNLPSPHFFPSFPSPSTSFSFVLFLRLPFTLFIAPQTFPSHPFHSPLIPCNSFPPFPLSS